VDYGDAHAWHMESCHSIGERGDGRRLPFGDDGRKNRFLNPLDPLFDSDRGLGSYHAEADCGRNHGGPQNQAYAVA
jgi:hypothetical protein